MNRSAPSTAFERHRPRLTRLAYQMTGSLAEAEDIVQEAFLRWGTADQARIEAEGRWLTTVVSRLCLDARKSAHAKRVTYVGPWLPEPVVTEPESTPFDELERAESLSMALMHVLEQLSAVERAAFLLREAFDYSYEEIGQILDKRADACRQLVRRARQQLSRDRPRFETTREEHAQLLERFIDASRTGRVDPLLDVLAEGVRLWSDGGGKVLAARNAITGARDVARFLVGVAGKQPEGQTYELHEVNGRVAIVGYVDGRASVTTSVDVREGRIHCIHVVMNPEKLEGIPPPA